MWDFGHTDIPSSRYKHLNDGFVGFDLEQDMGIQSY